MIKTANGVWGPWHYTTENCVTLLRRYLREGMSVLDVGTGTGILAIKAEEAGAGRVVAVDVSTAAVALSKENTAGYGVEVREGYLNRGVSERFDITIANLDINPALEFLTTAERTMAEGGIIILTWHKSASWLLLEEYFAIIDSAGEDQEYTTYVLKRKENANDEPRNL